MTLTPLSRWHGAPSYFNERAADVVFDAISKMDDDEAEVVADMLVGELFLYDQTINIGTVEKALHDHLARNGEAIRKGLIRSYVSKRQAGESVDGLQAAAEVISKAFGDDPYARNDRGRFASVETRARKARQRAVEENDRLLGGDYVQGHHPIVTHRRDADGKPVKPMADKIAERAGIPTKDHLSPQQKLAYQQAYRQVQAIVGNYAARDNGDHFVHLHGPGGEKVHPLADVESGSVNISPNLQAISISRIPGFEHDDLSAYDTLRAMGGAAGGNYGVDYDAEGNNAGVQRIRDLNGALRQPTSLDRAGTRVMTRMGAASSFLDDSFRDAEGNSSLPRSAQAALKAGKVVGLYGPEAQNVIGPAADRAAYRYRGTERTPDRRLTNALESIRRNPAYKDPADARELAVHGLETDNGWRPSGVLNYFRARLPDANLNTLQRKSGTIPPSEGVMFDKTGKVVAQAVGYGDDHYLPFNLKNLKPLRGGEYIRTRSWGGPTTEDVYTGLVAGAKSMSVVSHNGVYNIEFDEEFKGSRRYNDKAARMVARYGQLLDAVKNGEITTGQIDPSRMTEIEDAAASSYDPDLEPREFSMERDRLLARERRSPTFSQAQKAQAAQSFLDSEALKHRTPDGHEMTREELIDGWLSERAGQEAAAMRASQRGDLADGTYRPRTFGDSVRPTADIDELKADIARTHGLNVADPVMMSERAITAMGMGEKYQRFVEREEQTYRASLKPLELNGPGYEMALNALREQFPYYIRSVEFHPWADAQNGRDTGYVKPKHNRPADALAGYFDSSIDGAGKVHADTIRGQGRGTAPAPYKTSRQRISEAAKERATGAAEGVRTVVGGGNLSAADTKELRYQADKDLVANLKAQRAFGTGLNGEGDLAGIAQAAGRSLDEFHAQDWAKVAPNVRDLMQRADSEIDRMTPEELNRKVGLAMKEVEKHKLFDLDAKVVRNHLNGGRQPKAVAYNREDVAGNLRNLEEDSDYGQAVLQAGREKDPDKIRVAYGVDAKVKLLADAGMPIDLADPHFEDTARAIRSQLERRQAAVLRWKQGQGGRPADAARLPQLVEGLGRAKQYRRRLAEAESEQEVESPIAAGPGPAPAIHLPGGGVLTVGFEPPSARAGTLTPMNEAPGGIDMSHFESQF